MRSGIRTEWWLTAPGTARRAHRFVPKKERSSNGFTKKNVTDHHHAAASFSDTFTSPYLGPRVHGPSTMGNATSRVRGTERSSGGSSGTKGASKGAAVGKGPKGTKGTKGVQGGKIFLKEKETARGLVVADCRIDQSDIFGTEAVDSR